MEESLAEALGINLKIVTWGLFAILSVLGFFLFKLLFRWLCCRLKKLSLSTANTIDDLIFKLLAQTRSLFFLASAFFIAANAIDVPTKIRSLFEKVFVVVSLLQAAMWAVVVVSYFMNKLTTRHHDNNAGANQMVHSTFEFIIKILVWTLFSLLILDNLGVNVGALVTGLGVTGIAVALAVQNILGDLFASLSIVLDKPFVIGDFIIVGDKMGTVERIGLKTTRLRALSGEQLVFSNTDLLQSRVQNFKRMSDRRVEFSFGIVYETPPEKIEKVPKICEGILKSLEPVRFESAFFKGFGASSLDFVMVYYVLSPDFNVYMGIQQRFNLALIKAFAAENIEFSYPTQKLIFNQPLPVN